MTNPMKTSIMIIGDKHISSPKPRKKSKIRFKSQ